MCSRQFWNSHQRHKFLRAEETRDIVKIRVSEMAFPGVFKTYFQEVFSPGISNPFCRGSMDISGIKFIILVQSFSPLKIKIT